MEEGKSIQIVSGNTTKTQKTANRQNLVIGKKHRLQKIDRTLRQEKTQITENRKLMEIKKISENRQKHKMGLAVKYCMSVSFIDKEKPRIFCVLQMSKYYSYYRYYYY